MGSTSILAAGTELRDVLIQWMIREQDYLPLPNFAGGPQENLYKSPEGWIPLPPQ